MNKGRPPKFKEARRPVTVTLPESTLARLATIDPDRARAIVKASHAAMPGDVKERKPVELIEVMPGLGIIMVGPSRYLQTIKWLRLIELAPLRFLVTIPTGTAVDSLELELVDLLQNVKPDEKWEMSLLEDLRDLMRNLRLEGKLRKAELLFVDTNALNFVKPRRRA
ncbi:MAG TPA: hypothetical protein VEG60_17315 [Candidatus Binatia bacterium]|nr:hypothetical protein [Candidatus Binatia bacterium]